MPCREAGIEGGKMPENFPHAQTISVFPHGTAGQVLPPGPDY
jgi:hypothetical protein